MPRPRRCRWISVFPHVTCFRPDIPSIYPDNEITLTLDEFEAIRLKDLLGYDQEECAKMMNISQPTFHRIIKSARKKIADALVNSKLIRIQGGNYEMVTQNQTYGFGRRGLGRGPARGRNRPGAGRGIGPGGPPIECICPKCGYREPKQPGIRCISKRCPKCGTLMIRGR